MRVSGCSLVCGFSLCSLDVQTQHLCSARIIYHLYRAVTHRVNLGSVVSVPSADIRCPFCSKPFPGGRIEDHLLSCLTSPPLPYNSKYRATKILLQLCLLKGWWHLMSGFFPMHKKNILALIKVPLTFPEEKVTKSLTKIWATLYF